MKAYMTSAFVWKRFLIWSGNHQNKWIGQIAVPSLLPFRFPLPFPLSLPLPPPPSPSPSPSPSPFPSPFPSPSPSLPPFYDLIAGLSTLQCAVNSLIISVLSFLHMQQSIYRCMYVPVQSSLLVSFICTTMWYTHWTIMYCMSNHHWCGAAVSSVCFLNCVTHYSNTITYSILYWFWRLFNKWNTMDQWEVATY